MRRVDNEQVRGELRHAGYIKTWISVLKHDKRAIFSAASKATQAVDHLHSYSEVEETVELDQAA